MWCSMLDVNIYIHEEMRIVEARVRCTRCEDNDKACTELDGDPQTILNRCIDALEACGHV